MAFRRLSISPTIASFETRTSRRRTGRSAKARWLRACRWMWVRYRNESFVRVGRIAEARSSGTPSR
jgi:hypothetical protein